MKGTLDSGILEILALNMESWIRENFTWEMRNPTSKWNLESKFQWQQIRIQYLESGIHSVESDPESKTALDSVTWGERVCLKKVLILFF